MVSSRSGYVSYLLRLRRVQNNHRYIWVASVECTLTGEKRCFSGVSDFVRFIQAEFGGEEIGEDNHPGRLPDDVIGSSAEGETSALGSGF